MLTISFCCPLAHGLHARPAGALARCAARFQSSVTLVNRSNSRQANAKSALALVGADVALKDACRLQIDGPDAQAAHQALSHFILHELAGCDTPFTQSEPGSDGALPVFLARTTSPVLRGKGISPGMAQGVPVTFTPADLHLLAHSEPAADQPTQHQQLRAAWHGARGQLEREAAAAQGEAAQILAAHSQLLEDEAVEEALFSQRGAANALAALASAIDALRLPFRQSDSDYLRQRELDVQDVGFRLAAHLSRDPRLQVPVLHGAAVVICRGIMTPGQLLALRGPHLHGIVMETGAETSHTAILARAFSIPLLCVPPETHPQMQQAKTVLLDTRYGVLIPDPDAVAGRWFMLERDKPQHLPGAEAAPVPLMAPSLILLDETIADKHEAIKRLTDNLDRHRRVVSGVEAERAVWQREAVFSTALGFSVAIPHCKSPAILHNSLSVLRLKAPLPWGDGVDVRLVIMLTLSAQAQTEHMRIFSALARKLMHSAFREQLMNAPAPEALVAFLQTELGSDSAHA
ncbi:PTS fructose transporter subunit IIA [Chimaeribacter californicus]|uniref:PTS fructose transporter subunit IIA n=1 Tax=Chimaeribacter californicus TaxID=2060067 RepID=A0A2N5E221_9GAMM|nr:PTS sugar transporter subunit IIA [Chimaeribacter californicus]PLR34631.1 PTS fructose transporter subunit IIA [Chimaeribacter californicus]